MPPKASPFSNSSSGATRSTARGTKPAVPAAKDQPSSPPTSVKDQLSPRTTPAPNSSSTNRRPFVRRATARRSKPVRQPHDRDPDGDAPPPSPLDDINGGSECRPEQATPLATSETGSLLPVHDTEIRAKLTTSASSETESTIGASDETGWRPDTAVGVPPVCCADTVTPTVHSEVAADTEIKAKPTTLACSSPESTVGASDETGRQPDTAAGVPPVSSAETVVTTVSSAVAAGDEPAVRNKAVKRTVKVVKKLVKKKVIKKVPKSALETLARQSERADVKEGCENPNLCSSVTEIRDGSPSSTVVTNRQSDVSDVLGCVENTSPLVVPFSFNEAENLKSSIGPSCPVLVKEAGDPDSTTISASVKEEVHACAEIKEGEGPISSVNANSIISVPLELKNARVSVSLESEIPSSGIAAPMEIEIPDESEHCDGLKDGSTVEIPSEGQGFDSGKTGIAESCEALISDDMTVMEAVSLNSTEEQAEYLDSDDAELKEAMGKKGDGDMGSSRLTALSEKMEALERRKRRKTEIFIGGLDKDAKEEDIRKVFEEVGEVVEVRLMMNGKTGQNKGYAFLRYASAADAKTALEKYSKVKICGRECGTSLVEGNDTIFLGNIDKKWKNDDVLNLLQNIGIEKIDTVTVMLDPHNIECNRGYAFLELETSRDAQIAFKKLQRKEVFGKHINITVAWAEPLIEPNEEEMLKVKTVYAEFIPPSWDGCNVRNFFTKFGEVDNVVLARNLPSTKRKDIAFVNFSTREAALLCIESVSCDLLDFGGSKVNMKVSIAKPIRKGKQSKRALSSVIKKTPKGKAIVATQHVEKSHDLRNNGKFFASASSIYQVRNAGRSSSTNAELLHLLKGQASRRLPEAGLRLDVLQWERLCAIGHISLWQVPDIILPLPSYSSISMAGPANYLYSPPGRKRPFSAVVEDSVYSDPRGYLRTRVESSYPALDRSYYPVSRTGVASHPYYQHHSIGYGPGYGFPEYTSNLRREEAADPETGGLYRRYY